MAEGERPSLYHIKKNLIEFWTVVHKTH